MQLLVRLSLLYSREEKNGNELQNAFVTSYKQVIEPYLPQNKAVSRHYLVSISV